MGLKRVTRCILVVLAGLSLATLAQAQPIDGSTRSWSLVGGGGQLHIGNGLMLPIQAAAAKHTTGMVSTAKTGTTGTMFPGDPSITASGMAGLNPRMLKVPALGGTLTGTIQNPLKVAGGKQGYQRKLHVPPGVLGKPAAQTTVGVHFSNPVVFAVGTNLSYAWPAPAPFGPAGGATFSTGNAVAVSVITGPPGGVSSMTYTNALGKRFGGAAQFLLSPGGAGGIIAPPVTVYIKINAATPACTHPAFTGATATCLAGLIAAVPAGPVLGGQGGSSAMTEMTPGLVLPLNVAAIKMGLAPSGTITAAAPVAFSPAVPTNMATSQDGPWTTGQIVIKQPAAGGGAETFTLTGKDDRTILGGGTISMVSGSLSVRTASGPNANRGWVRLNLFKKVPAASPQALAFGAGLMVLAAGFAVRRYSAA